MKWTCNTALVVSDQLNNVVKEDNRNDLWESSSTIKIPIVLLSLQKMIINKTSSTDTLARLPHHNSNGSGIINWTEWENITFHDLMHYLLVYSDCVATNMLIDYIGGQKTINQWLQKQGYKTRLNMKYLYFSDDEAAHMPNVGTTTAAEMLRLYRKLDEENWPQDIKKLLNYSMGHVHTSWFMESRVMPIFVTDCKHKTGSMIDCGPNGETVFNAVGSFKINNKKYYFCLLSHGFLNKRLPDTVEYMKQHAVDVFANGLTGIVKM